MSNERLTSAISQLADMMPSGHINAELHPAQFIEAVTEELTRLRSIVEKLPKTADGDIVESSDIPLCHPGTPVTLWWDGTSCYFAYDSTYTKAYPVRECRLLSRAAAEEITDHDQH